MRCGYYYRIFCTPYSQIIMTILHAFTLGLLQGLTEFLPVSSSGHLVLAEHFLRIQISPENMQGLNIMLHAGTLLALLVVYRKTWWKMIRYPDSTVVLLVIATIPAGVVGILYEDMVAQYFHSLLSVGLAFFVTGLILLLGECCTTHQSFLHKVLHPRTHSMKKFTVRSALAVGCAQALALVPGLSRSGLTISAGRMLGMERKQALDFSFLMVVPVIGGATLLTLKDVIGGAIILPEISILMTAMIMSFASSIFAILFLRTHIVRRGLTWFAPYLFALSLVIIFVALR